MKIAIHSPRTSYYMGGAERYILNLAKHLVRLNINVYLVTYDAPNKSEWFKKFYTSFKNRVILIKSKEMDFYFNQFENATTPGVWDKESILFSHETKELYENSDFTDISYHYAVDCLGAPRNKKIHLHLHGLPDKKRKIENKAIKVPNQIIAVSEFIASGWEKLHKIGKKVHIVYNGIDLENTSRYKTKNKDLDVVSYGRLIEIKGIDTLLRALSVLKKEGISFKCKIIGEGPEKARLIKLSSDLGLHNYIEFLGKISDKDLFYYVSRSKIAVFASYKREGVLTTLFESAALNTAIISSDACSNVEVIKNRKNGLVFRAKDYNDLSNKIKELIKNEKFRLEIVKKMSKDIKEFSWRNQAEKILKLYSLSFS